MALPNPVLRSLLPALLQLSFPADDVQEDAPYHLVIGAAQDVAYLVVAVTRSAEGASAPLPVSSSAVEKIQMAAADIAIGIPVEPALAWVISQAEGHVDFVMAPLSVVQENATRGGTFSIGEKNGGHYYRHDSFAKVKEVPGVLAATQLKVSPFLRSSVSAAGEAI
ncbi:hypothetical protein [Falsarthrobacter nasiphocae]|uniref:Uncharacterized protein n=1 Tax=Falsarthrobacter nasiphocae TaxID=189863 RepID=A0AAE3YFS8_9MICC|nr:hypothetical protein [Falsarthrobacter nasiphocae]MDR6891932.1 hypothetical protein [Falsarthrobacter nasiphocae]